MQYSIFNIFCALFISLLLPSLSLSQERAQPVIRYLFSIDAVVSGQPFRGVRDIFIDNKNSELYALDQGNHRVVVTDLNGTFLYHVSFAEAGVRPGPPVGIAVSEDGLIYIAEEKRVAIADYRGMHQRDLDLSTIPDNDKIAIQSFAVEGNLLYIGDSGKSRIIVMDREKESFITEFKEGMGRNIHIAVDDDGIYIRDPAVFSVFRLDRSGKPLGRFGMVSGLAGGFSMTVDIAVDRKNGRVIVVDTNRVAVIFFDREGKFLFEFGGPEVFSWPSAVAADDRGRIYVSDATQKIRVFEALVETPVIMGGPEPLPAPEPPPAAAEEKGEVEMMVEKEGRLPPVFFDADSAEIKEEQRTALDKNADYLRKNPDMKIAVRGYADKQGTEDHNLDLSRKRAKAVTDYLAEKGIDPARLKSMGYVREISEDKGEEAFAGGGRIDLLVAEE